MPLVRGYGLDSVLYALLVCALLAVGSLHWLTVPGHASGFNVVWCAGHTLLERGDPYLQEPIHTCEARFGTTIGAVALPAPQPPYAIALFSLLARIPHDAALALWEAASILCVLAVAIAVARLAAMPLWAAAGATVVPMLIPTSKVLSLPPMMLTLVVLAAVALRGRRTLVAVTLLALASAQIDIAAPALVCLFVALPRARVPVLVAGAALLAIALIAAGPSLCAEYVARVVPAQAASETYGPLQFSLTAVLVALGAAEHVARSIGSIQSLLFIVAGIGAAMLLYRSDRDGAWLVLVPAGFAAIGGVYVHTEELAFAIPPLAMLAGQRGSAWAKFGLLLLSMPWYWAATIPEAVPLATVGPLLIARWAFAAPWWIGAVAAGAMWYGIDTFYDALVAHSPPYPNPPSVPIAPDALASDGWAVHVKALPNPPLAWIAKAPSMLGALALLPAAARAIARQPRGRLLT